MERLSTCLTLKHGKQILRMGRLSMQKGLLFWILMLIWLIFGLYVSWPQSTSSAAGFGPVGANLLLFLLIGLLGWREFGPPVQG